MNNIERALNALKKAAEEIGPINLGLGTRMYFKDLFKEFSRGEEVANKMIEAGYIDPETFHWNPNKGKPQGLIASILLDCQDANLFKQDHDYKSLGEIAAKSFDVEISSETFKSKKKHRVHYGFGPIGPSPLLNP